MEWLELIIGGLSLILMGVCIVLSATGIITIPDAVYTALSGLALALVGTRGRRISQKRNLKKQYGDGQPDESELDQDEHPDEHEQDTP